jgi:hypothetical protein
MFFIFVVLLLVSCVVFFVFSLRKEKSFVKDPKHPYIEGQNPQQETPWDGTGMATPPLGYGMVGGRVGASAAPNTSGLRRGSQGDASHRRVEGEWD